MSIPPCGNGAKVPPTVGAATLDDEEGLLVQTEAGALVFVHASGATTLIGPDHLAFVRLSTRPLTLADAVQLQAALARGARGAGAGAPGNHTRP